MPHVVYLGIAIACPWLGCTYQIELIDFQLELTDDATLYDRVMKAWGTQADFGIVGSCPGCGRPVAYQLDRKLAVEDPIGSGLPLLPDDWHRRAYIA